MNMTWEARGLQDEPTLCSKLWTGVIAECLYKYAEHVDVSNYAHWVGHESAAVL